MGRADPVLYQGCPAPSLQAVQLGVPLRTTSWSAWDALWAVVGSVLIANAFAAVAVLLGHPLQGAGLLAVIALPWLSLAGWPLFVTRRRGNGAVVDLGLRLRGSDLLHGLAGGAAAFAAAILAGFVTSAIFGDFTSAAGDQAEQLASSSALWVLVVFALMVVLGAPVAEELAFRGLLWSGLVKAGARPWVGTAATALAFAAIHFEPQRLLVLLAIGAVLGAVRWRTGSLGACIVAHAVNNLPGALGIIALGLA